MRTRTLRHFSEPSHEFSGLSSMKPVSADLNQSETPFMHIVVPRNDVNNGAIEPTLKILQVLTGESETALRFRNNVTVSFQGYDHDDRGLFEIGEVREFVDQLNAQWSSWFFFMTKNVVISPIAIIVLCLSRYKRSSSGLFIPVRQDSKSLLWDQFGALRGLCKVQDLPDDQVETAVQEVIDYLTRVGFVSGCDAPQLCIDSGKTGAVLRHMFDR